MSALLRLTGWIDAVNAHIGRLMGWLVLLAVLISAGNAAMRKAFSIGSNAYLEVQWYLFAAVFMLAGGYVMLRNGHVRIDVLAARLSARSNAVIDLAALLGVVVPLALLMIDLGWPLFARAWASGEMSQNAGGLIRWPVLLLIPLGFALLLAQAASEAIKRLAFLTGYLAQPFSASDRPGVGLPVHERVPQAGEPQP